MKFNEFLKEKLTEATSPQQVIFGVLDNLGFLTPEVEPRLNQILAKLDATDLTDLASIFKGTFDNPKLNNYYQSSFNSKGRRLGRF